MEVAYIKALHIIFVVTWFSGLFYIVRLFVYHTEAEKKPPAQQEVLQNQFKVMEKRLWYGITWPSAILTLFFGIWLVARLNVWTQPWMLLKFGFVAALFLYHLACGRIFRQLQRDEVRHSAIKMRIWNEVATLFLVAIVFIIVLKNTLDWIWGLVGLVLFAVVLMLAIRLYRKSRQSRAAEE